MSADPRQIEFESPATRVIEAFSGKDKEQFRIPADLPDITFLRALSVQGRLRYVRGSVTAGSTTVVFTPTQGETIFVFRYRVQHTLGGSSIFTFINDGITRDIISSVATPTVIAVDLFDSLVGDGSKTIGISIAATTGAGSVSLFGWSENTSRIRDVTI